MYSERKGREFSFWQTGIVLGLLLINLILVIWLLSGEKQPDSAGAPHRSIQQLFVLKDGLGGLEPAMEVMTVHGSIQYYADETDWLYFEQMAGGFSITLGMDIAPTAYEEFEQDGIRYRYISEALGSELAWENENGYMFYLYSSLDKDRLLEISKGLVCRTEGSQI